MADNKVTFLDKINFLLWLNAMVKGAGKMDKVKAMWDKLDGVKSVLGLLAVVAYYVCPAVGGPKLPDILLKIGTAMAGVGLAAKLEKGVGLLSKVIEYVKKGLDVAQTVVTAVSVPASK